MLGTVTYNLQRLVTWSTTLMSNAMKLMQQLLSKITGVLEDLKTLSVNLSLLFAQTVLKFKVLLAQFTTVVLSIKVALTSAKAIVTQLGLLLQTIVQQTRQLVTQVLSLGKSLVKKDTQDK